MNFVSYLPYLKGYSDVDLTYGAAASGGGVLGWVQRRLAAQLSSTVSAVGLVWWVTSMLSTAVHRMVCIYIIRIECSIIAF